MAAVGLIISLVCFILGWVGFFISSSDGASGISLVLLITGIAGTPVGIAIAVVGLIASADSSVEYEHTMPRSPWF